jgi:hypothetical protein
MLPASSPLKCTCPADIYLLLKSSDFITHDLSPSSVFEGLYNHEPEVESKYELELVLRKWYPVDRSRELRCFVRGNVLVGGCIIWVSVGLTERHRRDMSEGHELL